MFYRIKCTFDRFQLKPEQQSPLCSYWPFDISFAMYHIFIYVRCFSLNHKTHTLNVYSTLINGNYWFYLKWSRPKSSSSEQIFTHKHTLFVCVSLAKAHPNIDQNNIVESFASVSRVQQDHYVAGLKPKFTRSMINQFLYAKIRQPNSDGCGENCVLSAKAIRKCTCTTTTTVYMVDGK